ncbi:MAG: hypothetical protein H0W71_09455 [Sphingomonas sp.]|nr:hypothetical protein [Sphingomonas sp.]
MTTIYGLRRTGDREIRYVGRSNRPLENRLKKHVQNAVRMYPPRISAWIREAKDIEIFPLTECQPEDATRLERETVERCHADGNRLTNSHLLPSVSHVVALARAA